MCFECDYVVWCMCGVVLLFLDEVLLVVLL